MAFATRDVTSAGGLVLLAALAVASAAAGEQPLLQVQAVCRHGARAPLTTYPRDPHAGLQWENGASNLVPAGVADQFKLGAFLRRRYGELVSRHSCAGLCVVASERNRTNESARAVLLGLFNGTPRGRHARYGGGLLPPHEPLCPITTLRERSDYVLRLISAERCPRLILGIEAALRATPEYAADVPALKRALREHAGLANASSVDLVEVFDVLRTQRELGLRLPAWVERPLGGATIYAKMERFFALAFGSQGALPLRRLSAGGLLRTLLDNMRPEGPSAALFAAHDTTLAALEASLGVYSGPLPTSSCLLLELRAADGGGRTVRLLRRNGATGGVKALDLGCGSLDCPLETLKRLPWLPGSVEEVKQACQL